MLACTIQYISHITSLIYPFLLAVCGSALQCVPEGRQRGRLVRKTGSQSHLVPTLLSSAVHLPFLPWLPVQSRNALVPHLHCLCPSSQDISGAHHCSDVQLHQTAALCGEEYITVLRLTIMWLHGQWNIGDAHLNDHLSQKVRRGEIASIPTQLLLLCLQRVL